MKAEEFLSHFANQFEETPKDQISLNTEFRGIEEWSSMTALSVMAMVDEEYGVALKAEHIAQSRTVSDLFSKVRELAGK